MKRAGCIAQPGPARCLAGCLEFGRVGESVLGRREPVDIEAAVGIAAGERGGQALRQSHPAPAANAPLTETVGLSAGCGGGKPVSAGVSAVQRDAIALTRYAPHRARVGAVPRAIFCGSLHAVHLAAGHRQHPADCLTAPDDTVRPAQQLDFADAAGEEIAKIVPAARRSDIANSHAVNQHQQLLGIRAAHPHAGEITEPAVAADSNTRQPLKHAGDVRALDRGDLGGIDYADRLAGVRQLHFRAGCDDGDVPAPSRPIIRAGYHLSKRRNADQKRTSQ